MKAFRKWWEEGSWSLRSSHDDAEQAYRAALKEVLSQLKRPIYSADIMKWIEEELKDG